ncbi:MAG: hypothetical protein FJW96_00680 [Actinobacteria bacterium]|nr:hypothetical protein [Actinomycetota bacterium]
MTTTTTALIAVLGLLVVLGFAAVMVRPPGRGADDEVTDALNRMGSRMDEMANQLGTALRRVRSDGGRAQAMAELGHAADLD